MESIMIDSDDEDSFEKIETTGQSDIKPMETNNYFFYLIKWFETKIHKLKNQKN